MKTRTSLMLFAIAILASGTILLFGAAAEAAIDVNFLTRDCTTAPDKWYPTYGSSGHWICGAGLNDMTDAVPTGDPTLWLTDIPKAHSIPPWIDQFTYSLEGPMFGGPPLEVADVYYHLNIAEHLVEISGHPTVAFDLTILFYDVDIVGTEIEVRIDDQESQNLSADEIAAGTFMTWRIEAGAGDHVHIELDLDGSQQTYAAGFFLDNVVFVPEPATLALLGLGGVGLVLGRKRR